MIHETLPSQVSDDQQQQIKQWYSESYGTLLSLAAQHLIHDDAEKVLASLADQLESFPAKTQHEFQRWAEESVTRTAKLMAEFRDLYIKHQALVFCSINKGLGPVYRRDLDFCRTVEGETGALMGGNESAEELAAETWIEVLKKLGKFRPTTGRITTWIYRIAYLKALNHKKKRTRRSKHESFLTLDDVEQQEQESLTCSEKGE
jgi:hypothetical protein